MHEKNCIFKGSSISREVVDNVEIHDDDELTLHKSAVKDIVRSYRMQYGNSKENMLERIKLSLELVNSKLEEMQQDRNLKYYVSLTCHFYKPTYPDIITDPAVTFNSETYVLLSTTDLIEQVEVSFLNLVHQIDTFQSTGCGWSLLSLVSLDLNVIKYDPLKASSFINLPKQIKGKKACINVQNDDNKCFLWSILAHLHPVDYKDNPHYVLHYKKYENTINMSGISYPVSIQDIEKFERQNNVSINLFAINKKKLIFPVKITSHKKEKHVNLLYISNETNNHYVLIKNMSKLLANQLSNHKGKSYICDYCLHGCTSAKV